MRNFALRQNSDSEEQSLPENCWWSVPWLPLREVFKAKMQTISWTQVFHKIIDSFWGPHFQTNSPPGQAGDGSCTAHKLEGPCDHEQKPRYLKSPLLVQVVSIFLLEKPHLFWSQGFNLQILLSVTGGIWPRALRNLIYLWWLISALLAIQAGDDSKGLVRFVLLLSPLPVFLSELPIPMFFLPSMYCGNWHWKLRGQGMGFGFSKNGQLHHLAQQVLALWLGWANWALPSCKNMENLKLQ